MQFLFQNPLWLIGALAAVPLLAHLFSRTRPRRREFPSIWLLREAMRRVTRVRRPQDRWLLLLRTLAMAAIALAFLQPLWLSRFAMRNSAAVTAVLVVDVSASMGYSDGTRTRLAQAVAAAEAWLETLPANSRANVVWIQAHPASALPEPGTHLDFLRQTLRQAGVRPEPGDSAGALALATRQLAAAEGARELVVFSDFQKTGWRETSLEMPPGIRLTRIPVGKEEAGNVGLAGLTVEPARPVAGREARLTCRVRNFSSEPRRVTLFGEAGESRLSQTVEISPWGETLALLPVTFPQEGLIPLKVSISEDRFPGDDVCYGVAEVRGAFRVGIVGSPDDATGNTWARAAGALDGVIVRRLDAVPADAASRPDLLFVPNWTGQGVDALADYLRAGGALVLQPGNGLNSAALRGLVKTGDAANQVLGSENRSPGGWALKIAQEDHPVFALFAGGAFGDPAAARFSRRVAAPGFLKGKTLFAFDDGQPALAFLEVKNGLEGSAPLVWWNLDLGATDWAERTAFVPLFGELVSHLAQSTGSRQLRQVEPGEVLRFEAAAAIDPRDVRLLDEKDHAVEVAAESPRTPQLLLSTAAPGPGSYRWSALGGVLERAAINFPESESDLRHLSATELEFGTGSVIPSSARLGALREGRPLWPWCLAVAAICLLIEGALVRFFAASGKTSTPQPATT